MKEKRLRWFGHILRKTKLEVVEYYRNKVRKTNKRRLDVIESDMRTAGECIDAVANCIKCRLMTWVVDPN